MSDDLLDRAISAYTHARSEPVAAAGTRARLLRSAARMRRRRALVRIAALATVLVATNVATWAWVSGRMARAFAGAGEATVAVTVASENAGEAPRIPEAPPPEVGPASAPPRASTAVARVAPRRSSSVPVEPASPAPAAPEAPASEPLPPSAGSSTLDTADRVAFEAAHRHHFDVGPDAEALAAWDDYLARFPAGRFVPEATFNRAICLLRLGRAAEARPVLERIAAGELGPAHRADAVALLGRM
jgi:hypothetical protein